MAERGGPPTRFHRKPLGVEIFALQVLKTAGWNIPVLHGRSLTDGFGEGARFEYINARKPAPRPDTPRRW